MAGLGQNAQHTSDNVGTSSRILPQPIDPMSVGMYCNTCTLAYRLMEVTFCFESKCKRAIAK